MTRPSQLLRVDHTGWEEPGSGGPAHSGPQLHPNPPGNDDSALAGITPRLTNLLVPIDFSDRSRVLLRWSVRIAEAFAARISLVAERCSEAAAPAAADDLGRRQLDQWREREIPAELQGATLSPARTGGEGIALAARELTADLVVTPSKRICASGWRGLRREDSIGRALRALPCPVLSIDPALCEQRQPPPIRISPMGWQTILVWDDGTSDPASAIAWTAEVSRRTRATATILRYLDQEFQGMRTLPFDTRRVAADAREVAERELMARIRAHHWGENRPRILFRNGRGDAETVRQMACRMQADLVVVQTARDRPWWRALAADPIRKLSLTAPCPVLSVPG
jgi:nucleotide-binding universal stress UspA family protein